MPSAREHSICCFHSGLCIDQIGLGAGRKAAGSRHMWPIAVLPVVRFTFDCFPDYVDPDIFYTVIRIFLSG